MQESVAGRCWVRGRVDFVPWGRNGFCLVSFISSRDLEEISLPVVLQKLGLTQEQFVDLCILLGCDYCEKIRGFGPKKALPLLQQHKRIEQVLDSACSAQKHPQPENWPLEETRRLFLHPEVAQPSQVVLEWQEPDVEGLVQFLAHEKRMA
nr:flap endonuclease 1-like [Zootoca vivipara]